MESVPFELVIDNADFDLLQKFELLPVLPITCYVT